MYRTLLMSFILLFSILVSCEGTKNLTQYEGTVVAKTETSMIVVREEVEIQQQMELAKVLEKYDGKDEVLEFSMDHQELAKVEVGDFVVVSSNDNFDDLQPPRATAEKVKVLSQ